MSLKKSNKYLLFLVVILIAGIMVAKIVMSLKTEANNEVNTAINEHTNVINKTNEIILKDFSIINESKDTLLLSSLLVHPKLIYRFSELHCNSCIILEFENLRKHIASEGRKLNDIIILSYYQNQRNLNIFKRINKLQDFEIYNLMNNSIGELEIENIDCPYFFMLDKELKISNTFIPIKANIKSTDDYLKKIFISQK